jgi:hypothetical protein
VRRDAIKGHQIKELEKRREKTIVFQALDQTHIDNFEVVFNYYNQLCVMLSLGFDQFQSWVSFGRKIC